MDVDLLLIRAGMDASRSDAPRAVEASSTTQRTVTCAKESRVTQDTIEPFDEVAAQPAQPATVAGTPILSAGRAAQAAAGRAERERVPRKAQAAWEPAADRADPIAILEAQGANRVAELLP